MFRFPYGNLHGLNLDWLLAEWKKFREAFTTAFTASVTNLPVSSQPTVDVTYDQDENKFNFDFGVPAEVKPQSFQIGYAESSSGTVIPTGVTWLNNPPAVAQGNYLWSRTMVIYNDGSYSATYACSRMGVDGTGSPATATPLMDGVGAVGTSLNFAREDHVHPSDTSKLDASSFVLATATPIMDGAGSAGSSTDVARADHIHPSNIEITTGTITYETGFTATDTSLTKSGKTVEVNIYWASIAQTTSYVKIATLPTGYRPASTMYVSGQLHLENRPVFYINTSGEISIKADTAFTGNAVFYATFIAS